MNAIDRLGQEAAYAAECETNLRNLIGLANHPGFGKLLEWIRLGIQQRTHVCCNLEANEQETQVARSELRILQGFVQLFEGAESELPNAARFAAHLQGKVRGCQMFGIDPKVKT
jgi:hypothetical protein